MSTQQYEQVSGSTPNPDEQHEARSITRNQHGELYMMTEIGDGTFVQWLNCARCAKQVGECGCPDGPQESGWLAKARERRFVNSFAGRDAEPPLPLAIKQRDRTVNAVMRDLIKRGYTITPPAEKVEVKAPVVSPEPATVEEVDAEWDDAVQAGVQNGVNEALERARRRAEEEGDDVGF